MKKLSLYLLLGILLYFLPGLCKKATDGFSIALITSTFPEGMQWNSTCRTEPNELKDALNQPYRYLGCGGQCFAFISQDKRYVIKFFKTHFTSFGSLFLQTLPWRSKAFKQRKIERALFKLHRDFNSYAIASTDLQEETGIVYMHLNKSSDLHKQLHITDKIGIHYTLDLDRFEFAVQRRAEPAYAYIDSLIHSGALEEAKVAVRSLLTLSLTRCQKGIHDEDAKLERDNFGFLDDKPICIDIGRFVRDSSRQDPCVYRKDLQEIALQLRSWIQGKYPHLVEHFEEALHVET